MFDFSNMVPNTRVHTHVRNSLLVEPSKLGSGKNTGISGLADESNPQQKSTESEAKSTFENQSKRFFVKNPQEPMSLMWKRCNTSKRGRVDSVNVGGRGLEPFEGTEPFVQNMRKCPWKNSKNILEMVFMMLAIEDEEVVSNLFGIRDAPSTE